MSIIEIKNSSLELKDKGTLFQIPEFSISESDVVFFSGMNGMGKSTFFKSVISFSGFTKSPYAFFNGGCINFDGISPNANEKVIFVSQDEYLSPSYKKVKDVLQEGFIYTKCNKKQAVNAWIGKYKPFFEEELQTGLLDQRIGRLSGGQSRYIKVIQALERCDSSSVRLIILDEPVNHLDAKHIAALSNLILRIRKEHPSLSILISSHCHIFPFINKAYEIVDSKLIRTSYTCYNCIGSVDSEGFYF